VRDQLYQLYLGRPHGGKLNLTLTSELPATSSASRSTRKTSPWRPSTFADVDRERFAPRKPLLWFWQMFDRSPVGLNHWLGLRFRCMLGRHIFEHLACSSKPSARPSTASTPTSSMCRGGLQRRGLERDTFHTVGLPDAAVRESRDRVRAAIKNSGYLIPPTFITINLAPADLKKEGSGFDLPIAVGILGAYGALRTNDLSQFLLVGELGLDGSVRPVPGMLPIAILAREKGIPNLILPAANAAEAAVVEGVNVYPVSSLLDVLELLNSSVVGVIQREPFACPPRLCSASCSTSPSTSAMCAASRPPSARSKWPRPAATTFS
jgi:hypothetical protein